MWRKERKEMKAQLEEAQNVIKAQEDLLIKQQEQAQTERNKQQQSLKELQAAISRLKDTTSIQSEELEKEFQAAISRFKDTTITQSEELKKELQNALISTMIHSDEVLPIDAINTLILMITNSTNLIKTAFSDNVDMNREKNWNILASLDLEKMLLEPTKQQALLIRINIVRGAINSLLNDGGYVVNYQEELLNRRYLDKVFSTLKVNNQGMTWTHDEKLLNKNVWQRVFNPLNPLALRLEVDGLDDTLQSVLDYDNPYNIEEWFDNNKEETRVVVDKSHHLYSFKVQQYRALETKLIKDFDITNNINNFLSDGYLSVTQLRGLLDEYIEIYKFLDPNNKSVISKAQYLKLVAYTKPEQFTVSNLVIMKNEFNFKK